jgi:hypothetical protein
VANREGTQSQGLRWETIAVSDDIDIRIDTIEWLAANPPPPDQINEALRQMTAKLAAKNSPQLLHNLLHLDPATILVGLSTSSTAIVEVAGQGYARQGLNSGVVKFPAAQSAWGAVEAIILFSDDTPLAIVPLSRSSEVVTGDSLQIDVQLTFS